jgi:DNA-nicking Smr family endonuclease
VARDRRRLGPDDEALWTAVKRTVEPLRPEDRLPPPRPPVAAAMPEPPADIAAVTPQAPPPARPAIPSMHPLGRRERQKVAKGRTPIDSRIDLHGLTQDEAHARLAGFLARAHAEGQKVVLVITGKGRQDGGPAGFGLSERGVLRRVVPIWLSLPAFRPYVLGFEEAHLAHGGGGALYVRIRRRRA